MTPGHGVPTEEQQMAHVELLLFSALFCPFQTQTRLRIFSQRTSHSQMAARLFCCSKIIQSATCLSGFSAASKSTPNIVLNGYLKTQCLSSFSVPQKLTQNAICLSGFSAAWKSTRNILSNQHRTTKCLSGFSVPQKSTSNILLNVCRLYHVCPAFLLLQNRPRILS